jgi:nitrate reductase gamma subunit
MPGFQLYRIYGTHQPVLKKLKEAYETCQESGDLIQKHNLWLWILYVGTLAERANVNFQVEFYFHSHFVAMARIMHLFRWEQVQEVLSTFLYSDSVGVKSEEFFVQEMRKQFAG